MGILTIRVSKTYYKMGTHILTSPNKTKAKTNAETMVLPLIALNWPVWHQKACTEAGDIDGVLRLIIWNTLKPNKINWNKK